LSAYVATTNRRAASFRSQPSSPAEHQQQQQQQQYSVGLLAAGASSWRAVLRRMTGNFQRQRRFLNGAGRRAGGCGVFVDLIRSADARQRARAESLAGWGREVADAGGAVGEWVDRGRRLFDARRQQMRDVADVC